MRNFSDHGDGMFEPVQILGGPRTRAIIQRAPDTTNVSDQFISPRLTARVKKHSMINPRTMIQTQAGEIFLCAYHQVGPVWRTLLLFPCDRQVTWKRSTKVVDTVTGLEKTSPDVTLLDTPWVYWERPTRPQTDFTTRIPDVDFVVAMAGEVQMGDTINDHTIIRLDLAMGVTILGIRT